MGSPSRRSRSRPARGPGPCRRPARPAAARRGRSQPGVTWSARSTPARCSRASVRLSNIGPGPLKRAAMEAIPEDGGSPLHTGTRMRLIATSSIEPGMVLANDALIGLHQQLPLRDLAAADSYTLQHSIDVTALGLLIARRHFHDFGRPAPYGERSFEKIEQQLIKL